MRKLFGLAMLVAMATTAQASTVNINLTNFVEGVAFPSNTVIRIRLDRVSTSGTWVQTGRPVQMAAPYGVVSTNLGGGKYWLSVTEPALGWELPFWVPGTGTNDVSSLMTNGVDTVASRVPFVTQIVAGTNVTVSPADGKGSVTVSTAESFATAAGSGVTITTNSSAKTYTLAITPYTKDHNAGGYSLTNLALLKSTNMWFLWQDPANNSQMALGAGQGTIGYHTESVGVGYQALKGTEGSGNTAVGNTASLNSTGNFNAAFGLGTLASSPGNENAAFGYSALAGSVGEQNAAVGAYALNSSPGTNNSAIGDNALLSSAGNENSAIGHLALAGSPGNGNTAIGNDALSGITGSYNTAVGHSAGTQATGGSSNVFLGAFAGPSAAGAVTNKLYIANAAGTPLIWGDFSAKSVEIDGGQTIKSNLTVEGASAFSTLSASDITIANALAPNVVATNAGAAAGMVLTYVDANQMAWSNAVAGDAVTNNHTVPVTLRSNLTVTGLLTVTNSGATNDLGFFVASEGFAATSTGTNELGKTTLTNVANGSFLYQGSDGLIVGTGDVAAKTNSVIYGSLALNNATVAQPFSVTNNAATGVERMEFIGESSSIPLAVAWNEGVGSGIYAPTVWSGTVIATNLNVGGGSSFSGTNFSIGTNVTFSKTQGTNAVLTVNAGSANTIVVTNGMVNASGVIASNELLYASGTMLIEVRTNTSAYLALGAGIGTALTNSVGVGYSALNSSPGNNNSAMGYYALRSSPGNNNSAMGYYALNSSPGNYNSAMGDSALNSSPGNNNSAMGYSALRSSPGNYNSAMGYSALRSSPGNYNSAMGYYALNSSPGNNNSAMGNYALNFSPGNYNSAMGYSALRNLSNCVVSVRWSSQSNYNGLVWLVVGGGHGLTTGNAIISQTSEAYNGTTYLYATNILTDVVCITNSYKSSATTGTIGQGQTPDYNIAMGHNAGFNVAHGRSNVYLGAFSGPSAVGSYETNQLYIANKVGPPLIGGDFAAKTIALNGTVTASNFTGILLKAQASEPVAVAGSGQIYSATNGGVAEVYVQGDDGTETQVSAHPGDAPAELYDTNKFELEQHIVKEVNPYVTNGVVRWVNTIRMARLTELNSKAILFLAGKTTTANSNALERLKEMSNAERQVLIKESFAEYNARTGANLKPLIWEEEQAKAQAAYDAERTRVLAEYEAGVAAGETNLPTVPPAQDVRRPKPTWMSR